jgi:TPR repeat protein
MSVATKMMRADMYYCGTGFEALKCYVIDAEKGNKAALYTLSDIYEHGVKSRVQKELGDIYYNGLGVEQNCPEGVKWYIKAAGKGHPEAIRILSNIAGQGTYDIEKELGDIYYRIGQYSKAAENYVKAAERGNRAAIDILRDVYEHGTARIQKALGDIYYYGLGVEQNCPEGVKWYIKAAGKGNSVALHILSDIADQGNYDVEKELGDMYYSGSGVPRNYANAAECYAKAAEKGNKAALDTLSDIYEHGNTDIQKKLGDIYYNGHIVGQNYAEAMKWYAKSAEHGNADAQFRLGDMYCKGQGADQNCHEGEKWYIKAAGKGNSVALHILSNIADQGNYDVEKELGDIYYRGKQYLKAAECYAKAAEKGNEAAIDTLGNIYEHGNDCIHKELGEIYYIGRGVKKNHSEALRWYIKAAEHGNVDAKIWFQRVAEQGDAEAQLKLGYMFYEGLGVPKNYILALKWYKKAAEQGNVQAMYSLGEMYYYGDGVEDDDAEAAKWYQRAAERGHRDAAQMLRKIKKK